MSRIINLYRTKGVITIILLLVCIAVLGIVIKPSGTRAIPIQETLPQIINETKSFEILSVIKKDGYIEVSLRNISQKNINGYTVAFGSNGQVMKDTTVGDHLILPQNVDDFIIPNNVLARSSIRIINVMFDDGTFEGNPVAASEFRNRRLGLKVQLKRILALLQSVLNSPDVDSPTALDRFKAQVSSLTEKSDGVMSRTGEIGLHDMKEEALALVKELEERQKQNANLNLREYLAKLKQRLEKRYSNL